MTDEVVDWWTLSLPDFASKLHQKSQSQSQYGPETTTLAAIFQARVAWQGSQEQKSLVRWLVLGTWALVVATLLLALRASG